MRPLATLLTAVLFIASSGVVWAFAADPAPAEADAFPYPPDPGRLRCLYVPYPDLDVVFGRGRKGVLLPRVEFERLLREARAAARRLRLAGRPPVKAVLLSAECSGHLEGKVALIEAAYQVEVLDTSGTTAVLPLPLAGAAVDEALLEGRPALIGSGRDGALALFIPRADPGRRTLRLKLAVPLQVSRDRTLLRLRLPSVPAGTMTLTAPGRCEVAASQPILERTYDKAQDRTTVRLALGSPASAGKAAAARVSRRTSGEVVVVFTPAAARRARGPVLLSDIRATVALSGRRLNLDALLDYTLLRGAVDRVDISLPAGLTVSEVVEPSLLDYRVGPAEGGRRTVTVRLEAVDYEAS